VTDILVVVLIVVLGFTGGTLTTFLILEWVLDIRHRVERGGEDVSDDTMPDDLGVTHSTGVIQPILWERRGDVVHLAGAEAVAED